MIEKEYSQIKLLEEKRKAHYLSLKENKDKSHEIIGEQLDRQRAQPRAGQCAAPADGHEDDNHDGLAGLHIGWIDDAHLRHVKHARQPGNHPG